MECSGLNDNVPNRCLNTWSPFDAAVGMFRKFILAGESMLPGTEHSSTLGIMCPSCLIRVLIWGSWVG